MLIFALLVLEKVAQTMCHNASSIARLTRDNQTLSGGAVPIMNQYDTCQLVQKWFLKSCLLGRPRSVDTSLVAEFGEPSTETEARVHTGCPPQ